MCSINMATIGVKTCEFVTMKMCMVVWLGQLAALVHYCLPLLDVALPCSSALPVSHCLAPFDVAFPYHLLLPACPWCDALSSSHVVWISLMLLSFVV